jgi:hypothetical protein
MQPTTRLEDHLVRPVALPEAEGAGKVALQELLLLNSRQNGLVHTLLVLSPTTCNLLLLRLLALLEETLFAALLVGLLVARKVLLVRHLLEGLAGNAFDGDGGAGGDHVAGIDAAEGHTVDFEGTGDQEDALGKDFEENDALAAETTGEEDEDGAGLERGAGLVWVLGLACLCVVLACALTSILLYP